MIQGISKDGRKIKQGKLYRSGSLFDFDENDLIQLRKYNIRYVVDLRSEEERDVHNYSLPQDLIRYECSALHTKTGLENFYFFLLLHPDSTSEEIKQAASFVREGYTILPFHNNAFQLLLSLMEKDDGAILFHCSSGKDRTGVLAALIQKLLGISDEEIIKDYLASNDYVMENTIRHADEMGFQGEARDTLIYCCTVHEELLSSSFAAVKQQYQSWDDFFQQEYGIDAKKKADLKHRFLEDNNESRDV